MITVNVFQQKSTLKVKELCIITHPFQKTLKNNKWVALYSVLWQCFHRGQMFSHDEGHWMRIMFQRFYLLLLFFNFLSFLGPLPRHMEIPRLVVQSELQPPAQTRATATWDPSRVCNLHHSSWQECQILNPLSKARDQTCNLMVPKSDLLTTAPQRELLFQRFFHSDNI